MEDRIKKTMEESLEHKKEFMSQAENIKKVIEKELHHYKNQSGHEIIEERYQKFRSLGQFIEKVPKQRRTPKKAAPKKSTELE